MNLGEPWMGISNLCDLSFVCVVWYAYLGFKCEIWSRKRKLVRRRENITEKFATFLDKERIPSKRA